jgi:hypothetical protein
MIPRANQPPKVCLRLVATPREVDYQLRQANRETSIARQLVPIQKSCNLAGNSPRRMASGFPRDGKFER